jgi:predicted RNA-binding Zn ribbon-like protein
MAPDYLPVAPGALLLVQRFVNSITMEGRADRLREGASTLRWLQQNGEDIQDMPAEEERLRLIELRGLLRTLLQANSGGALPADAIDRLNALARGSQLVVQVGADGEPAIEPVGPGVERMAGRLLATMYSATLDGSWRRLKLCASDTCGLAYWDGSKNRSATWCSMAVCGNRAKVRRYQRRQASARREAKA